MKSIIIYATRYGSTGEAAKRIQKEIGGECTLVNIMTDKVPPLDGFDTVILGGSIYIGRVQKQLTAFMQTNLKKLLSKNIGLYICAAAQKQDERDKEMQSAFPPDLYSHAAVKDLLGYAFAFDKMRFFDKVIMKKVKGDAVSTAEYFDDRIKQFAKTLA